MPLPIDEQLKKAIRQKGLKQEDDGQFVSNHSLFSIPFRFKIETIISIDKIDIKYTLQLSNQINAVIAMLVLGMFLTKLSFGFYLWVTMFLAVGFYGLSFLIINNSVKQMLLQLFEVFKYQQDLQQGKDFPNNFCPACGFPVDDKDLLCPSCGLRLKSNPYTKPLEF